LFGNRETEADYLQGSIQSPEPVPAPGFGTRTIRVLAFIEAPFPTTGPAKNLLEFARQAKCTFPNLPRAEIAIATFDRRSASKKSSKENEFVSACKQAGLEIHVIRERFAFDASVLGQVRRVVDEVRPDIIQTHAVKSHFLIKLTGSQGNRRWIAFHHGYTRTSTRTRLYNLLDRWSLRSASRVVTVCRPFLTELARAGVRPEQIFIQHNAVQEFIPPKDERVSQLRAELEANGAQIVLSVGRLSREKGQTILIEAANILRRKNGGGRICFVLAGEGPDQKMLQHLVRKKNLEQDFRFLGHVRDLAPYYCVADAIVLPSHSEGSPNVLLEAMAAGRPIIATAVGGVPEIVTNGKEAITIEKRNAPLLAEAIEGLLHNPQLRMSLSGAAKEKVKVYSSQAYCESLLALYANCLGRTP
jgi:glycosyltransferase involved in cell wall biosynthesis